MRLQNNRVYDNNNNIVAIFHPENNILNIIRRRRIPNNILRELGLTEMIEMNRANDRRHEANRRRGTRRANNVEVNRQAVVNAEAPAPVRQARREFTLGFEIEYTTSVYDRYDLARKIADAGIPCEAQGYNHNTSAGWKIVTDGSLSGRWTGEIVSPILNDNNFEEKINAVGQVLKATGTDVTNKSAGLHVHIKPVRGKFTKEDIKAIYIAYKNNEALIDSFMAKSRRSTNNRWSGSLNHLNIDNILSRRPEELDPRNGLRYHKINFCQAWSSRGTGTIEFRHHQGTCDAQKIIAWAKFIIAFVKSAKNLVTYSTLEELLDAINLDDETKRFIIMRRNRFVGRP